MHDPVPLRGFYCTSQIRTSVIWTHLANRKKQSVHGGKEKVVFADCACLKDTEAVQDERERARKTPQVTNLFIKTPETQKRACEPSMSLG